MIYQIKRGSTVIFEHEIKGTRTQSAPAVDFVDIEFDYKEAVLFKKNDTIDFKGETYYCDRQYNNENKQASKLYRQRARFVSENYRATEIAVLDPQGKSTFDIEANLLTLLTLAVTNLNRLSSGWSYNPSVPNTVTKTFEMSEENVMSFLVRMSGEFQIPFDIKDKVISFREPQHIEEGLFKYGKGNGFLDLTKTYRSGERVPNLIYATGFEGLTPDINPIPYQPDIDENGVIEGFYTNENIKPTTRTQMVGSVTANNVVVTDLINYDLNTYKIAGQTPLINFETGALGGSSFYITNSTYDQVTEVTVLYLKRRTIDGVLLPSNAVRPLNGDYFNITNIRQPQEVVDEAKTKLAEYAYYYLDTTINRNLIIQASLDPLFTEDLNLNDKIHIFDADLNIDGKFIINEIKESLQDLNKKDITLDFLGFSLYSQTFKLKNDNIIELGIDTNRDDLVVIEEELSVVKADMERIEIDLEGVKVETDLMEIDLNNIQTVKIPTIEANVSNIIDVELPLKENNSNKVNILEIEAPTSLQYPDAISVKGALNLKQNLLSPASNVVISNDVISVKVNNTVQNVGANAVTSVANKTYSVQNDASGSLVVNVPFVDLGLGTPNGLQLSNNVLSLGLSSSSTNGALSSSDWNSFNNKLDANDLDGFVYDATYNTTTHVLTLFRQNAPNVVIDFPTEDLIANIDVVGDDLVITFQDGTTKSIPLNTLLVGVVKSVNGLSPNSQGEIVLQLTDIPNLSSELANKLDIRMAGLVNNLTQPEKDVILVKLGVTSNVTQVLSLNSNTISLSGGGGSIYLNIANIGGLQTDLDGKVGNFQNAVGLGFSSGDFNLAPYIYHSSGQLRFLATQEWVNSNFVSANNGDIEYYGTGSITGGGKSSANQSVNTSYTFDLTPQTKTDIGLGVSAYNSLGNYQPLLSNGLHTIVSSNKVNVEFEINTPVTDKSGNIRLIFGNTSSTDIVIHGAVANGDFKVKDSAGADVFRMNGNNKVPYFPQLPAPQTMDGNIAIFDTGNGLWKHATKISDLVTQAYLTTQLNFKANTDGSNIVNPAQWISNLGINTALNLQQVTNNGNYTPLSININDLILNDNTISNPKEIGFYNSNTGASQRILTGGLLASDNYADASLIPANGIYSKGNAIVPNAISNNHAVNLGQLNDAINGLPTPIYYTGSTGVILVGKDFQLNASTLNSLSLANSALQVETDPTVPSHVKAITTGDISNWNSKTSNLGTVTSITAGTGLSGGTITTSGTIDLSAATLASLALANSAAQPNSTDFVKNTLTANDANVATDTIWTHANQNLPTWFPVDQSGTLLHKQFNASFATQLALSYYGGIGFRNKSFGNFSTWYKMYSTMDFDIDDYALISQIPTNNNQLANGSNYTTLPIVQSWIGTQNFSTQTLTAGTNISIVGNAINNTAPNVQSDWNATSGLAQILNKPTIPNAPNNGTFTVQGDGVDIIGSGSTSADASVNTSTTLSLSAAVKSDIEQGIEANLVIPSIIDGVDYQQVNSTATYNVGITKKKTIVNVISGLLGGVINVEDGLYDGYELAINGCNEWHVELRGNIQDKCRNQGGTSVNGSVLFWWVAEIGMWVQAI